MRNLDGVVRWESTIPSTNSYYFVHTAYPLDFGVDGKPVNMFDASSAVGYWHIYKGHYSRVPPPSKFEEPPPGAQPLARWLRDRWVSAAQNHSQLWVGGVQASGSAIVRGGRGWDVIYKGLTNIGACHALGFHGAQCHALGSHGADIHANPGALGVPRAPRPAEAVAAPCSDWQGDRNGLSGASCAEAIEGHLPRLRRTEVHRRPDLFASLYHES